jgi:predicted methyltransferase
MNGNAIQGWLLAAIVSCAGLVAGCATDAMRPAPDYEALVASADRSDVDRATDARRPAQLLAFYGVRPGMTVLDVGASAGYNTELLARAVGPSGRVYAQNTRPILENIVKGRFDERLQKPVMKNVVHLVRDFEDPVPADVRNLDLVTFNFTYHDTAHLGVDRARMNRAIFNALKPGGIYIVADHSGRPGTGVTETKSLHRIEEAVVRREAEAAGFRLVGEGGFLRNPNDPRTASVFKPAQPNDEFVLKFVKP